MRTVGRPRCSRSRWADRSPRKGVTCPMAHKAQWHPGPGVGQLNDAPVRGPARDRVPPQPWPSRVLTFPHGHGQDGSPGLEAFHRAKSLGDRFSLKRSAEMLRSPVDTREGGAPQRGLPQPSHLKTNFHLLTWSSTPSPLLCPDYRAVPVSQFTKPRS